MPEIDINIKRNDPKARIELETFWKENVNLNNPNNLLIPLGFDEAINSASSKKPNINYDLFIPLGKNHRGYITFDLNFGHNIIAGGGMLSGVGMFRRVSLLSLLKSHSPNDLKIVLIDPIGLMKDFENIPHLILPRAKNLNESLSAIRWCESESERRFQVLLDSNTNSVWHLNKNEITMPEIVIFISELADVISINNIHESLAKMANITRATSIHFIITTQQPSLDTLRPVLKDAIPNRIAFQMPYEKESKIFIDEPGAESLLGQGDMFFRNAHTDDILSIQGLHYPVLKTADLAKKLCQYQLKS